MAPRKKSKAKKLTETMRQRQMRLRREAAAQKAAKNQKALPPGKKGGALAKTKTTKALPAGKTPKALPPGKKGGALTKRKAPTGKVNVKGALGNVALAALAGYVADKANKAANPETWKKKSAELKAAMNKPKPKVKGAGGGQGNRGRNSLKIDSRKYDMDSQPPKGPNRVKPAKPAAKAPAKPAAKKPAAKKPATKAPARSKTYSQADMMRDIRAADRTAARSKELRKLKDLREEAKRKSLEQAKKNRKRRNTTARGPRER